MANPTEASKVTISSSNSMFNGKVTVLGATNETIVVGAKVKELDVTAASKAKIDAGTATKVTVKTAKDVELKTNGDITLDVASGTKAVINAAANSTITLASGATVDKLEIKGSGVTLKVAAATDINNAEIIGAKTIIIDSAAGANLSKVKAEEIVIDYNAGAAGTAAIDLAKDANITFTKAQTTNKVTVEGKNAPIVTGKQIGRAHV